MGPRKVKASDCRVRNPFVPKNCLTEIEGKESLRTLSPMKTHDPELGGAPNELR